MIVQVNIAFNESYRQFPFYMLLNAVTIFPHAYGLLLFLRYMCGDGPLHRACLPIASLILLVTTFVLIFQVSFI
jgi:hypothetical protein